MSEKKQRHPKGTHRKGYTAKAPAVCVVMHDLGGMPVSDKVVKEFLNAATAVAVKYGYVLNVTTQ